MLALLKLVFGSASSTISHQACLNLCQRVIAHWNVWKRYVPCLNSLVFNHGNNWKSHLNFLGRLIVTVKRCEQRHLMVYVVFQNVVVLNCVLGMLITQAALLISVIMDDTGLAMF